MVPDLRSYLDKARKAGPEYYLEVTRRLSPDLEVSAIQHKLASSGRFPVLSCRNIKGSDLPLVTNLFGCYPLLGIALDMTPGEIRSKGQAGIVEAFRNRKGRLLPTIAYRSGTAPIQEVVLKGKKVDLGILPITKHAAGDSSKYISSGLSVSRDLTSGKINMGIYREELKSHNKLGCRINPGSNGTEIARNYARSGKRMEIVTVIGHHPLVCMAAGHLVPLGVNEFEVAGGLLGKNIETVPAVSVDLPVPAYGEIAIEGYIDTKEPSSDGPVAEAMGFYGQARECYVINVTAITMRNDAIYHDLYPAHQEHFMVSILDRQIEAFDRLRNEIPSITAVNYGPDMQPGKTLMYIAIDKHSNSDAKRVGETVLKTERWVTMAVVVDSDVNVYDDREVLWAIATNVRGEKSIFNYPAERKALGLAGFPRAILDATRASPFTIQQRVVPPPEVLSRFNLSRMFHIN